ncbi:MAG: cystathionine beta-lyase [Limnohabitans sp.]|nr:cystathionine beta-lyase [Limnohabitans sp.]
MQSLDGSPLGLGTRLAHETRTPFAHHGFVNTPIHRGSTVLFKTLDELEGAMRVDTRRGPYTYGLIGNPNSRELEKLCASLDGGAGAVVVESGLAAVSLPLLANLAAGDHALFTDSCYGPTRHLAQSILPRMGVTTEFYNPRIGAEITRQFRSNTKFILLESPGSLTFEVQDVPAIVGAARACNIVTAIDNTWATPLFMRPIEHGVDLVIHALTKYQSGNSDILLGAVIARDEAHWANLKHHAEAHGHYAHPDDCATCLRGMRSLEVRLKRHEASALQVAQWLESRAEVGRVLHPALASHPDHAIWRRDFTGSSGLFGCVLKPQPGGRAYLKAFLEGLRFFGMGFSWGGFESLVVSSDLRQSRVAPPWTDEGPLLRFQIGLEDPRDLISDLAQAFDCAASAAKAIRTDSNA